MKFLEKDLEEFIFKTDNKILHTKNLYVYGQKKRQLRIGNYGVADIVTCHRHYEYEFENGRVSRYHPYATITVYELKRKIIDIKAVLQGVRYCAGIKSYLEKRGFCRKTKVELVLIGDDIKDKEWLSDLTDLSENISIVTYSFLDNGDIYFDYPMSLDNRLENDGFKIKK